MRRLRVLLPQCALVLAFPLLARGLGGQALSGTVRDSASSRALPGSVVLVLGERGDTLGRVLVDASGAFRVSALGGETLRILRMGYRPQIVPLRKGPERAQPADVRMSRLPTLLAPMQVRREARCPHRADRPAAFGLWEQARTALLGMVLARGDVASEKQRIRFAQVLDDEEARPLRNTVRIGSGLDAEQAFESAFSAREFARRGFATGASGALTYHGPDAAVILDEDFVVNYCIALAPADSQRPAQVGVSFAAANRARGTVTIEGVIWVDTARRMLQEIAFEYRGLSPSVQKGRPGGRITYLEHPNGVVMIDRWQFRLVGEKVEDEAEQPVVRPGQRQVSLVGGELARVRWPDGTEWRGPLGEFVGFAVDSAGRPLVGVTMKLDDTDYEAVTDSTGAFAIPGLIPGPYEVVVGTPRFREIDLDLPTQHRFTAAREAMHSAVVTVPSQGEYILDRCREADGAPATRGNDAFLIGRVYDSMGQPAGGAVVTLASRVGEEFPQVAAVIAGNDGTFTWCDGRLARGREILVSYRVGEAEPTAFVHTTTSNLTVMRLVLPAPPPPKPLPPSGKRKP